MEKMKVRDLMILIDKFPRISQHATFYEAVMILEAAQEKFLAGKVPQRIVVVEDDQGGVMGKISPIDLLRGLETNYNRINTEKTLSRFGFSYIWKSMQTDYNLWENPFKDLCRKAQEVQVKDIVKPPSQGQTVGPEDTLAKCFHLFVMNRHDALFAVEGGRIAGLLRFSDVYKKASAVMKECGVESS